MTAAAELKPGQSVFDHDHPLRARLVHSVVKVTGDEALRSASGAAVPTVRIRWGHPDEEPQPYDDEETGLVPADKSFDVVER